MFSGGTKQFANRRHGFFAHGQPIDRNRCSRAHDTATGHVNLLAGQGDECASRQGFFVDKCNCSHWRVQQDIADLRGRIRPSARCIDVHDDRLCPLYLCLAQHPAHVGHQTTINVAGHSYHDHALILGLSSGKQTQQHTERHPDEKSVPDTRTSHHLCSQSDPLMSRACPRLLRRWYAG